MGKDGASRGSYGVSGPELATNGSDEALEVPDGAFRQNRASGVLGLGPERLGWGLRRLR